MLSKAVIVDNLLLIGSTVFIFGSVFAAYWTFFTFFPRLFPKDNVMRQFIKSVRFPVLLLFFLLGAVLSSNLWNFPEYIESTLTHGLLILFIATFGFLLSALLKSGYLLIKVRYETGSIFDLSKRSVLTQVQFLYRAAMFGVALLTAAGILMTFPAIKNLGLGIFGSAGIAGLALGVAARPILLNFMAGFQIAMSKMIKIGDVVVVEKESGRIEYINLTHIIVKIWDLRYMIVPISYFIDNPFQNWTTFTTDLYGVAYIYCDYSTDVEKVRKKFHEILEESPFWDKKVWGLVVTDINSSCVQLRASMSAADSSAAFNLTCHVREKLLHYLQQEYPSFLPQFRLEKKD